MLSTSAYDMNKVVIFDWDDTICPSSFVDQWKVDTFRDLPLHFQNLFKEIGKCAEKCLDAAAKCGEVIIITNSDDGWVKFSAERFVPNLLHCLDRYKIVSARTRYERFYPSQPLCWKAAAFAHEVNEHYSANGDLNVGKPSPLKKRLNSEDSNDSMISTDVSSSDGSIDSPSVDKHGKIYEKSKPSKMLSNAIVGRREVISFGDSMEERTAVKIVASQLEALPKSVMFISSPTPMQIIGQLVMVMGHMKFLCNHEDSLDLEISPHQAQKAAEAFFKKSGLIEKMNPDYNGFVHSGSKRRSGSTSTDTVVRPSAQLNLPVSMD